MNRQYAYIPRGDGYVVISGNIGLHNLPDNAETFDSREALQERLPTGADDEPTN